MIRRIAAFAVALAALAHADPAGAAPSQDLAKLANEKPVVELVTMGVGELIWERHGHIALCIHYDNPRDDRCYNYGIGDFHHPLAMTWGFFRGAGSFWVGKMRVEDMLEIYEYADRTIWAQPLPLTQSQKRQLIDKLEFDILEPNRYYAYDHFWDNCTTRVRDVIDRASGGQLSAMRERRSREHQDDGQEREALEPTDDRTFRDLAREGFYGMRIPLLITDIAMGRVTDRVPTYFERMFLPQYLREAVTKLWGIEPVARYERHGPPPLSDGPSGRVLFALVILLATAPAWITRRLRRWERTGLAVAIAPYVLLGTVLTFLAIISPLPYVRWNETCLVWLPLDVLVMVLSPPRRRTYARMRLVMLAALFVLDLIGILRQPLLAPLLWPAIPLAVAGLWPHEPRAAEVGKLDTIAGPRKPRARGKRR